MKNMLILTSFTIYGGVEKALINLLKSIDYSQYNVDLIFLDNNGPIIKLLPKEVNVKELVFKNHIMKERYKYGTKNLIIKYIKELKLMKIIRLMVNRFFKNSLNYTDFFQIEKQYDLAICYNIHFPILVKLIAASVKANFKVAFIHGELFYNNRYKKIIKLKKFLDKYDGFYAVSEHVKKEFQSIFPEYKDKTKVKYNFLNKNEIFKLAKETIDWDIDNDITRIVTVARLSKEKGCQLAIQAAKLLKQNGINFKWHFVGDGAYREFLFDLVCKYNLNDNIVFEGGQINPYKYIFNADIYVQPSLTEGWCLTLQEARILNKPIVTTNFPTAYEQIKSDKTGLIVEKDSQSIAEAIIELINNKELKDKLVNNLILENKNQDIETQFDIT